MPWNSVRFSSNEKRLSLWLGAASLFAGVFLKMTSELLENEVQGIDSGILTCIASIRRPWLTSIAVDVTALGSITIVALISFIAFSVLLSLRDRPEAWQLLLNSAGAGLLALVTKNFIERARPESVTHLVQVSGFSYPSAIRWSLLLYLTIAILTAHHLPTRGGRVLLYCIAIAIILLVGLSRMYLGVHYPTDVVSGISLGVAWALLLAATFSMAQRGKA